MLSILRARYLVGVILAPASLMISVLEVGGLAWTRPSDFMIVTSPLAHS